MNNMTRSEFFTYNQNFNKILVIWINKREERLTEAKFLNLPDCDIMLQGAVYRLRKDKVIRAA